MCVMYSANNTPPEAVPEGVQEAYLTAESLRRVLVSKLYYCARHEKCLLMKCVLFYFGKFNLFERGVLKLKWWKRLLNQR